MSKEHSELRNAIKEAKASGQRLTIDPQLVDNVIIQLDAARQALDFHTERDGELKTILAMVADRVDDFVYDEFSTLISDEPLNEWCERYVSRRAAAEAKVAELAAELEAFKPKKESEA